MGGKRYGNCQSEGSNLIVETTKKNSLQKSRQQPDDPGGGTNDQKTSTPFARRERTCKRGGNHSPMRGQKAARSRYGYHIS